MVLKKKRGIFHPFNLFPLKCQPSEHSVLLDAIFLKTLSLFSTFATQIGPSLRVHKWKW